MDSHRSIGNPTGIQELPLGLYVQQRIHELDTAVAELPQVEVVQGATLITPREGAHASSHQLPKSTSPSTSIEFELKSPPSPMVPKLDLSRLQLGTSIPS